MPADKNIRVRYRILDTLLQDNIGFTIKELLDKCNKGLELKEYSPINKRTLQNDLLYLENDYGAEIEKVKVPGNKRSHKIRYQNRGFSIFKTPLSQEDSSKILTALDTILSFKGLPQFDWLESTTELMKQWTLDQEKPQRAILFEENHNLEVSEKINEIYDFIRKRQVLRLVYEPFGKEEESHLVSPYLLKQFNNRWFLLCQSDQYDFLINLALDRIKDVTIGSEIFREYSEGDPENFYEDIVGVTRLSGESEMIKVLVRKDLMPYLLSKPIHDSQKELKEYQDGEWKCLQFDLIPNYEFYSVLLSHGPRVKVDSPDRIKQKMAELTTEMFRLYSAE